MADSSKQCPLPRSVEKMIRVICKEQSQSPPEVEARRELAFLGEEESLKILAKIRASKIRETFTGFIIFMARKSRAVVANNGDGEGFGEFSPSPSRNFISPCSFALSSASRISNSSQGSNSVSSAGAGSSPSAGSTSNSPERNGSVLSFISDKLASIRLNLFSFAKQHRPSPQMLALEELEFRRAFLVLSYMGRRKLEDEVSVREIRSLVVESRKFAMGSFENLVWQGYGHRHCSKGDRMKYHNWDSSRQYHFYHCHVHLDGSYAFKGPFLSTRTTLLQKILKDENVLVVKFVDDGMRRTSKSVGSGASYAALEKLAREGIYFGKRCYRFFAFKDGGKREKDPMYSSLKSFFVNLEAFAQSYGLDKNSPRQARSAFLHLDTLPNLSKYTARLELVLSKTITLPVNLNGEDMYIQVIDDIPCQYEDGSIIEDQDGQPFIHTDGTGFISEDLALRCPRNGFKENLLSDHYFEGFVGDGSELNELPSRSSELPLLMQFRLFYDGYAVKGTVLLNRTVGRLQAL